MTQKRDNETIRRLDRKASKIGLPLQAQGNKREFTFSDGSRVIRYKPGGKGVLRVDSLCWSESEGEWFIDATCVTSIERVEGLMVSAMERK